MGAGQAGHTLTPATPTHARKYTLRGTATRPQATKIDAATVATALSWLVVDVCGRVHIRRGEQRSQVQRTCILVSPSQLSSHFALAACGDVKIDIERALETLDSRLHVTTVQEQKMRAEYGQFLRSLAFAYVSRRM